jgi:hypothetical protein
MSAAIGADEAWLFCGRVFADAERARELLAAQDAHGLDIVLELFVQYLRPVHGVHLTALQRAQAEERGRPWRADAIAPLRAEQLELQALCAWAAQALAGLKAGRAGP